MKLCLYLPQTPRSYPLRFWIQHPFKNVGVMDQYLHWQHWGWCRYLYFLDLQPQVFTPTSCYQVYHIIVLLYRCLICRGIVVEMVENNFFPPIWQEVNTKIKDPAGIYQPRLNSWLQSKQKPMRTDDTVQEFYTSSTQKTNRYKPFYGHRPHGNG